MDITISAGQRQGFSNCDYQHESLLIDVASLIDSLWYTSAMKVRAENPEAYRRVTSAPGQAFFDQRKSKICILVMEGFGVLERASMRLSTT